MYTIMGIGKNVFSGKQQLSTVYCRPKRHFKNRENKQKQNKKNFCTFKG